MGAVLVLLATALALDVSELLTLARSDGTAALRRGRQHGTHQSARSCVNYFKHAAGKRTLSRLSHFVWWRVIRWQRALHRWRRKDVRHRFTSPDGRGKPITTDGIELFDLASVPVTRYRHRGNTIPNLWTLRNHAITTETVKSPVRRKPHAGFGERPGETERERSRHRAPGRLNRRKRWCCAWTRSQECRRWTGPSPCWAMMMPGMPERRSHDYVRHGVTSLIAAFNIADGTVIQQIHRRRRAVEFKKFLVAIDKAVPDELDVYLVCDNLSTHKTPAINDWLAKHPASTCTSHRPDPPGSTRWNARSPSSPPAPAPRRAQKRCRTGKDVHEWIKNRNEDPKPFAWTKTADEVLNSLHKYVARISGEGLYRRQLLRFLGGVVPTTRPVCSVPGRRRCRRAVRRRAPAR